MRYLVTSIIFILAKAHESERHEGRLSWGKLKLYQNKTGISDETMTSIMYKIIANTHHNQGMILVINQNQKLT